MNSRIFTILSRTSFNDWPIRRKLIVIFIVLTLLPVHILLYLNASNQISRKQTEVENQLLIVVSSSVRDIQVDAVEFITSSHLALESITNTPELVAVLDQGIGGGTQPDLPGPALQPGNAQSGTPPGPSGQAPQPGNAKPGSGQPQPVPIIVTDTTQAAIDFMADFEANHPGMSELSLLDLNGVVLAGSSQINLGMVAGERPDVATALNGSKYTESIRLSPHNGAPGFFISTPVYVEHQIAGVLAARLQADFILNALLADLQSDVDAGTFPEILILDPSIIVMAHSTPSHPWLYQALGQLSEEELAVIKANQNLGLEAPPETLPGLQALADELESAFDTGEGGLVRYCVPLETGGQCRALDYYRMGYQPVDDPITDTPLFLVASSLSEAGAARAAQQQVLVNVTGGLTLTVLLLLAVVLVARTLTEPILRLAQAAEQVEKEESFEKAPLVPVMAQRDELGVLANVFARMAEVVQERERQLKQTVEKLKIEIDQARRQKEVDEIASGEFFQKLKEDREKRKRNSGDVE
jgi:HAMP domain-containing protein